MCGVFDIHYGRMTLAKTLKLVIGVTIKVRFEGEYQVWDEFETPLFGMLVCFTKKKKVMHMAWEEHPHVCKSGASFIVELVSVVMLWLDIVFEMLILEGS